MRVYGSVRYVLLVDSCAYKRGKMRKGGELWTDRSQCCLETKVYLLDLKIHSCALRPVIV